MQERVEGGTNGETHSAISARRSPAGVPSGGTPNAGSDSTVSASLRASCSFSRAMDLNGAKEEGCEWKEVLERRRSLPGTHCCRAHSEGLVLDSNPIITEMRRWRGEMPLWREE